MKNLQKYQVAFLLILIFSIKIISPVFSNFHFTEKNPTEQQEEKNDQEKSGEKSPSYEIEANAILNDHYTELCLFQKKNLSANFQALFLPVQYFAIPTPPPWCKS